MDEVASGPWSPEEAELSINARELLAVERGLFQFCHLISGSTVVSSWTIRWLWRICASKEELALPSSAPLLSKSSVGRSLSRLF